MILTIYSVRLSIVDVHNTKSVKTSVSEIVLITYRCNTMINLKYTNLVLNNIMVELVIITTDKFLAFADDVVLMARFKIH